MSPEEIRAFILGARNEQASPDVIAARLAALAAYDGDINSAIRDVIATYQAIGAPIDLGQFAGPSPTAQQQPAQGTPTGTTTGQPSGVIGFQPTIQPSQADVFRRFVANTFNQPQLGQAATGLLPLASTQFALQQPAFEEGFAGSPFAQFLGGGQALLGEALQGRLEELAGVLRRREGFGLPLSDPAQIQLGSRFADPNDAFAAFALQSQQAASPAFRNFLARGQQRAFDRFLQRNPNATAAQVAGLFNF